MLTRLGHQAKTELLHTASLSAKEQQKAVLPPKRPPSDPANGVRICKESAMQDPTRKGTSVEWIRVLPRNHIHDRQTSNAELTESLSSALVGVVRPSSAPSVRCIWRHPERCHSGQEAEPRCADRLVHFHSSLGY